MGKAFIRGGVVRSPLYRLCCGACQETFSLEADLEAHLLMCPAAKALLPIATRITMIGDEPGQPLRSLVCLAGKYAHLIKQYCFAVAFNVSSRERTRLHRKLCERLRLEPDSFKPFEDGSIPKGSSPEFVEAIFWQAVRKEADAMIQMYADGEYAEARKLLVLDFFDPMITTLGKVGA